MFHHVFVLSSDDKERDWSMEHPLSLKDGQEQEKKLEEALKRSQESILDLQKEKKK